jgi:TIR domain/NACHT domain
LDINPTTWDFFLAHAGADLTTAEKLYDLLLPYKVFLDSRCLLLGDDWDHELSIAQRYSLITVVLVSSRTEKAYYQREEIAAAIAMARADTDKHRVVPVFLDDSFQIKDKMPYGLRLKHGLSVEDLGGLEAVAERLRDLFEQIQKKELIFIEEPNIHRSLNVQSTLIDALGKQKQEDFLSKIVIPLVEKLHPGHIEFTTLPDEINRGVISFGFDLLKKHHLLYVHVDSLNIPAESSTLDDRLNRVELSRKSGVIKENQQRVFPDEIWLITSRTSSAQIERRMAQRVQGLSRKNIKVVFVDELSKLLMEHLPDIASWLSEYSSPEIIKLISSLSKHNEARAFGFSSDRSVTDFYVTAALSPHASRAYAAIRKKISINDYIGRRQVAARKLVHSNELEKPGNIMARLVKERIREQIRTGVIYSYNVRAEFSLGIKVSKIRDFYKDDLNLPVQVKFNLKAVFQRLVRETAKAIRLCPSVLGKDVSAIRKAWDQLESTEKFVRQTSIEFNVLITSPTYTLDEEPINLVRISVPEPENLLRLDKIVLVEGPPGCGKTTLLRILAINLLGKKHNVLYLQCSNISSTHKKKTLMEIVQEFAYESDKRESMYKESILVIDGLDEAPFDLSEKITLEYEKFANVIVSTRSAFETIIRNKFFHVALSPFNNRERDLFFEKWFKDEPELLIQAKELIKKYPDIDFHTRLPLIATITVALLQNGVIPKTRAETYGFRLDLLLSKWDKFRGVKRLFVDNPDAKRRLLRELAYNIHSSKARRRNIKLEELRDVYEKALGTWGYNVNFDKILHDLVVGSGVLIQERPGEYSFGHLTFQEHLVGEYIAKNFATKGIASLLGNDWWREPLNFYASIEGDITDLINYMMSDLDYLSHVKQLAKMTFYAPYTSPGAVQTLNHILMELSDSGRSEEIDED